MQANFGYCLFILLYEPFGLTALPPTALDAGWKGKLNKRNLFKSEATAQHLSTFFSFFFGKCQDVWIYYFIHVFLFSCPFLSHVFSLPISPLDILQPPLGTNTYIEHQTTTSTQKQQEGKKVLASSPRAYHACKLLKWPPTVPRTPPYRPLAT